jgi:hypothetical protein
LAANRVESAASTLIKLHQKLFTRGVVKRARRACCAGNLFARRFGQATANCQRSLHGNQFIGNKQTTVSPMRETERERELRYFWTRHYASDRRNNCWLCSSIDYQPRLICTCRNQAHCAGRKAATKMTVHRARLAVCTFCSSFDFISLAVGTLHY